MGQDRLSEKETWQNMYLQQMDGRYWPFPDKRCSAFELDRIYQKYLPKHQGAKIIEFGCGGSKWLPYFYKVFNYDIYGVDYSEEGCKSALSNLEKIGGKGQIFCRDFSEIGEEFNGEYDLALSYGVVEHFTKPEETIAIFSRYLRDNGIIITYVPNFSGVMGTLMKRLNKKMYDTHNIFRLPDLVRYHEICGLDPIYASYLEFADFTVLSLEVLPIIIQKILKNLFYLLNRSKLLLYKRFDLNPQSNYLCAAMIVLARKPASSTKYINITPS